MDATQKQINEALGISDEVFAKYNPGPDAMTAKETGDPTDTQRMINKALGISEETWRKYNPQGTQAGIRAIKAKSDEIVTIIPKFGFQKRKEV
jgi:hypothetical protein